jgi:membrane-bound lytic murein transglycosylase B
LYRSKFPPPPPPPGTPRPPKPPRLRRYPNGVTPENAAECRTFIALHEAVFARIEKSSAVPRSIAASLLFVETRLGRSPGKHKVLYALASMAAARDPSRLGPWMEKLNHPEKHLDWIGETMRKRSDWAYTEFVAFLTYVRANNIDPLSVMGSIYGAMGMCQFIPSNIPIFAVDGDNDGVIDLYQIDDAVASLSNYLVRHGWKPDSDRKAQFAALRRYNHEDVYANTILCLADLVRGEAGGQVFSGKKAPAKKPAGKTPAKQAPKTPTKKTPAQKTPDKQAPGKSARP